LLFSFFFLKKKLVYAKTYLHCDSRGRGDLAQRLAEREALLHGHIDRQAFVCFQVHAQIVAVTLTCRAWWCEVVRQTGQQTENQQSSFRYNTSEASELIDVALEEYDDNVARSPQFVGDGDESTSVVQHGRSRCAAPTRYNIDQVLHVTIYDD
jgi:hypothetical protein